MHCCTVPRVRVHNAKHTARTRPSTFPAGFCVGRFRDCLNEAFISVPQTDSPFVELIDSEKLFPFLSAIRLPLL